MDKIDELIRAAVAWEIGQNKKGVDSHEGKGSV